MAKQNRDRNPENKPVGRPSVYHSIFYHRNPEKAGTPEEFTRNEKAWERLGKLVHKGLTNEQLAAVYEVEESTIYNWQESNVEFLEALENNKRRYDDGRVVRSLYERANGWRGKETKAFVIAGKIETVEVIKHYAPETSAIQTWLYNRQPELWRSINHIDYTSKTPPPLVQYDYTKLSDEELEYFELLIKKMTV